MVWKAPTREVKPTPRRHAGQPFALAVWARGGPFIENRPKLLRCATVNSTNRTIAQRELRNQSAAVLREVQAGRTLIVTRNGEPIAELRPIQPRRYVPRAIIADAAARAPRIDAARFRADLDVMIDQTVDD